MNKYYRVETETGIIRSITEEFPSKFILDHNYICTMFYCTREEFDLQYKALWPHAEDWKLPHWFTPLEDNHNFCARCGLYFVHKIHYSENVQVKI